MASKKKGQLAKYCHISQWIEQQDPELADAIHRLCLDRLLTPGRNAGVTFLYPEDKSFRQEIIDKTFSENPDEAAKIIESLIIPDIFLTAAEFSKRAVGSRLGVKYVVKSAEGSKVILADGVELSAAKSFKPFDSKTGKLAVWNITKGRPPLTGEPYRPPMMAKPPPGRRPPPKGLGGAEPNLERLKLAHKLEGEFEQCLIDRNCNTNNAYLKTVVSFLNFLKANHPDVLLKVSPILDFDAFVTFYLLFEPYKTRGEYLIPSEILYGESGWNGALVFENAANDYKKYFVGNTESSAIDPNSKKPTVPMVFRDRQAVTSQILSAMQVIRGKTRADEKVDGIKNAYKILLSQNSIGGMSPILPDSTIRALAANKKLWQDEFRFTYHIAMGEVVKTFDVIKFKGIIGDMRLTWTGDDYEKNQIVNSEYAKSSINYQAQSMAIEAFLGSTDFLYLPVSPDIVGGGSPEEDEFEEGGAEFRNLTADSLNRLNGIEINQKSVISNRALSEVALYAAMNNGALPPEVEALRRK